MLFRVSTAPVYFAMRLIQFPPVKQQALKICQWALVARFERQTRGGDLPDRLFMHAARLTRASSGTGSPLGRIAVHARRWNRALAWTHRRISRPWDRARRRDGRVDGTLYVCLLVEGTAAGAYVMCPIPGIFWTRCPVSLRLFLLGRRLPLGETMKAGAWTFCPVGGTVIGPPSWSTGASAPCLLRPRSPDTWPCVVHAVPAQAWCRAACACSHRD